MKQLHNFFTVEPYFDPRGLRHYAKFTSTEIPDLSYDFPVDPHMGYDQVLGIVFVDIVNKANASRQKAAQEAQEAAAKPTADNTTPPTPQGWTA